MKKLTKYQEYKALKECKSQENKPQSYLFKSFQLKRFGVDGMKNFLGIGVIILVLLMAVSTFAALPDVTQVSYSPSPAVPGSTIAVLIQIENKDNVVQKNVTLKVDSEYPFTVKTSDSEQNPKDIGSLDAFSKATATFTVYVDPTAQNQTYNLPITIVTSNEPNGKKSLFPIVLSGKSPIIKVLSVTDGTLMPGQEKEITLTVQNVGTSPAYDVVLEMQEDRTVTATGTVVERDITPVGAATAYIASINPGEQKTASLKVNVSNTATIKNYTQPIKVSYRNGAGDRTSDTSYIGLKVFGTVDFDATLKDQTGSTTTGQKATITIEIFNKGLGKAEFTLVEMSADDATIDSPKQFIGSLGPNDVDTAKTTLTFTKEGARKINVKISYTDSDATTKTITVPVQLLASQSTDSGMGNIIIAIIVIVIIVGAWKMLSKKKKNKN